MKLEILTHRDALHHTAKRVIIAVGSTLVSILLFIAAVFGTDPDTLIQLGAVTTDSVLFGMSIAAILTGVLTYRSSLLMRELNLTRTELLRVSRMDQLTGLLNRRGFNEAAIQALEQAGEANLPAVALMFDIDRFKAINDRFGHEFGDKVLVEIGAAIHAFADANGMLASRHGGEEFAILMIGVTTEQAIQQANELRRICAATRIREGASGSASVTVSIGLAASSNRTSLPNMMRAADKALYLAKRGGRNRVVPADEAADVAA
jgi:diguanylate cyclase (GGDEF)-like protein